MIVNFDLEKIESILRNFHTLTKVTISVFDADFNQLIYYPKTMPRLCTMIKSHPEGNERCKLSDKNACIRSYILKRPVTYVCHAGLMDTATAIMYENNLLGFMLFGQVMEETRFPTGLDEVRERCAPYRFGERELEEAYRELNVLTMEQLTSAANILEVCSCYLYISQMVKVEKNILATNIDSYISGNLESDLSVAALCAKFDITKNKLYEISKQYFKNTVGSYVTAKRIQETKHLLTTTDLPIYLIGSRVGIPDYNYLIKLFKREVGVTPLVYRKNFPHHIL